MDERHTSLLGIIINLLTTIERKIDQTANTQADLAAGLTAVETAAGKLGTDLAAGITLLEKAIADGTDTSASVARLSAIAAKLTEFDAEVVAAEAPAIPAPAPTPAPTPTAPVPVPTPVVPTA